jgi:ABC-2 type transport system permease protein
MAVTIDQRRETVTGLAGNAPGKWGELVGGVYTLWRKHMKKFSRSVMEIGGTLFTPVLWMLLFGLSMGGMVKGMSDFTIPVNYIAYITPGLMLLTCLTAAILGGTTLLLERTSGIIKEYLIAPVPRLAVLLGTMSSSLTKAMLQAVVIILLGLALGSGLVLNPLNFIGGLLILLVFTLGFVGIAAAAASKARGMESYHTLIGVLNLPVLFLSNALYPLDRMPAVLAALAYLNPTTYAVDAARNLFYGAPLEIGLWLDIPILLVFMALGLWWGFRAFQKSVATPV